MSKKRRGRGEGSIEHLTDGRWLATASLGIDRDTGKRKRKKFYGKSKAEVLARLRDFNQRRLTGQAPDTLTLTVGEWLDRWLAMKRQMVEESTYLAYEQHVRIHLRPFLGAMLLRTLEPHHLTDMQAKLAASGVSGAMRRKVTATLRLAFHHAHAGGYIGRNPAAHLKLPSHNAEGKIHPLTQEQVAKLLESTAGDPWHSLWLLAIDSGARQGELLGLNWDDFNPQSGTISITRSLQEVNGYKRLKDVKTGVTGRRVIRLTARTVQALNARRAASPRKCDTVHGPIFFSRSGGRLRKKTVKILLDKALLLSEIRHVRFHDLRHTCATLLLLKGVNVKVVAERLGHANIETTLRTYAHVLPAMQEAASHAMDAILSDSPPTVHQAQP